MNLIWFLMSLDCVETSNRAYSKCSSLAITSTIFSLRTPMLELTLLRSNKWTASFFTAFFQIFITSSEVLFWMWCYCYAFSSFRLINYFINEISQTQIWMISFRNEINSSFNLFGSNLCTAPTIFSTSNYFALRPSSSIRICTSSPKLSNMYSKRLSFPF